MSRHRRRRGILRRLRIIAAAVLLLTGCGAAFAYWASTGAGAGAATTTTPAVLTISPGTPTSTLYPGSTAAVTTTIANSGTADVRISSIALASGEGSGGYEVDASHTACGLDSLTFSTQTTGWTVPAGGSTSVTLSGAMALASDADDECQGATFTVHLKVAS